MRIVIDFETYCDLDINLVGAHKYADHPSCRILCMSYKIDDNYTEIWTPEMPWPDKLKEAIENPVSKIYAFGATFEILIWLGPGRRDFPQYFIDLPLSKFIDVRALTARYRLPQKLDAAGKALNCNTSKMASGKRLIRVCCTPNHNPTKKDFTDLYTYCIIDTDVLSEIINKLPADHFTPSEQKLWELTYRMNNTGVPVEPKEAQSIIDYLAVYMKSMISVLPEVTDSLVQTPGQIQKIKQFCKIHGVETPNLQADTVTKLLNQDDVPEDVKTVLEIRQLTGLSSLKKFVTIINMENDGVVQGNLNFHRAGTGRWGGQGFQYHNLPRAKVDNPDTYIEDFINKQPIEKPAQIAKALIRPMIKAPEGYKLIVSDYSSIENRMLAWLCDDEATLNIFRQGGSQYKDMASFLYNIPVNEIDKDSQEYMIGKMVVLGCGYQMGKLRMQAVAADWGVMLSIDQAEALVRAYRTKYILVVKMWKAYSTASKMAVQYPGRAFNTHKCVFKVVVDKNKNSWLRITLPSGRGLMYSNPRLEDDKYGTVVKYTGFNSKIFQMTSLALTPGLITENIDQGASRDILANGMLMIDTHMPEVQLSISVHDEAGGLIKETDINDNTMSKFDNLMCTPLSWCKNLPLEAKGYIAERYRKD
jgi:DNA polymerase